MNSFASLNFCLLQCNFKINYLAQVKPVPVPYPVKSYSGYKSGNSGGGGGGEQSSYGSSSYDSGNMYDSDLSGSSKSNSLSNSDDSSAYSSSNSNIYEKYSSYGQSGMDSSTGSGSSSGDYVTGTSSPYQKGSSLYHYDGSSSAYGMPSGSTATKVTLLSAPLSTKSTLTSYSPYASATSNHMNLGLSSSQHSYPHPHHHLNSMKDSATENYFYTSATSASGNSGSKALAISDDYGARIKSASSASTSTTGNESGYQIAPVYQGPNGQLYSNGQLLSKEFLKSNTVVQAFPASANSKLGTPAPFSSSAATTGKAGAPASTNMSKNVLHQYSAEIEEAKKWFSGVTSKRREDSAENTSVGGNVSVNSSSNSSSSEEDSSLEKEKGKGKGRK